MGTKIHKIVVWIVKLLHRIYKRTLSPLFGNACRFHPYCSDYAVMAIESHGLLKGSYYALMRLLRCHPWHPGGEDPVPPKR